MNERNSFLRNGNNDSFNPNSNIAKLSIGIENCIFPLWFSINQQETLNGFSVTRSSKDEE